MVMNMVTNIQQRMQQTKRLAQRRCQSLECLEPQGVPCA